MKSALLLSGSWLVGFIRRLADHLIKNTGARFHNTCTPLFMHRLKDMIIVLFILHLLI